MTTAKKPQDRRPPLARKVTPRSEANRKAPLDTGLKVTWDGKDYIVRAGDLTALEAQALRLELGLSFNGLMTKLETDPDIDLIAGVVWLARRINGERGLLYAEVAGAMGYDALDGLDFNVVNDAEDVSDSPEG